MVAEINPTCHLILLGAPGSGKGTQSKYLVDSLGYNHVSTGDLLRSEIASGSKLGLSVQNLMENGQLVSDELVLQLLQKNVDLSHKKYIFDGFPRNRDQAEILDEQVLAGESYRAIYFAMDTEKLLERLVNRRVSPCGRYIYNLRSNPPKVTGVCDVTGEQLVHRDDDKKDVILKRMEIFEAEIKPVLDFYEKKGYLVQVSAEKKREEISSELAELIRSFR